MEQYIDLHTHTLESDGVYSPLNLIKMAKKENITHLAITDHNRILQNIDELRNKFCDMELISGSEISSQYYTTDGEKKEVHIVGLFLEHTRQLHSFLAQNRDDGTERINAMLQKLVECGINLDCNSFAEFKELYFPERRHIGRPQLAEIIMKKGFTKTVDEAMDIYIGDYGEKIAYVPSNFNYADIKNVVNMIHGASGIVILAHPMSYKLTYEETEKLIEHFAYIGGDGMEVLYGGYGDEMRRQLKQLADKYSLLESCGSDYHGNRVTDRLNHCFPASYLERLRDRCLHYR